MATNKLLVTGASGHLGRLVLDKLLLTQPAASLIAVTRDTSKLEEYAKRGVDVRKGSFDDSVSALATAFSGATSVLIISTDKLDVPGARLAQHRNAVAAAKQAGAKHLVYTSLTKCEPGLPIPFAPDHYQTERAIADSGLEYTVLRNNWYADMVAHAALQSAPSGKIYSATKGKGVSAITRDDCATAAAAALARGAHGKEILEITGGAAVTWNEIAKLVSAKTGKPVEHVGVERKAFVDGVVAAGVPAVYAEIFASFHDAVADGSLGLVTKDFETLTGRAPTSLAAHFDTH